ncbi:MAG: lysophospholipid acyltransferase family protein [Rhodocyclaceae bacterium]|nr:lysophospholipid acyltransferase family protein [Rhodocyclaceae bacterium]
MAASFFRLLARLPLPLLHLLGAGAGWLVWFASAGHRRRMRENLALALGRTDPRVLRAAIVETGRQLLELPFVWLRPQVEVLACVRRVEGVALLERAQADGASVLLLTPHLGCFEILGQYLCTRWRFTALYRPPRQAALRPSMEAGRARENFRVAPADLSGVRSLVRALRSGEMVIVLPDQVPKKGEGVWMPFFGRPAWTMTLAARLSQIEGVRTVMMWAERLPRGEGYVLRFTEPVEPLSGSVEARCATINREIERLILACPQQYMWSYDRYRRRSGVPAPETAEAAARTTRQA